MSDDQLSTVQQLWRDRRPEFEAYLNGEMDVTCNGERLGGKYPPSFDCRAELYKFHPKPAPPKLRPLTREEWIERRDWWIRKKSSERLQRIVIISLDSIEGDYGAWDFDDALKDAEMSPDLKTWQPCGVPESEVGE